jgi:phosphopantothenate-cysteine ligase
MKKVLITGGPTNEYIDEVMKITNMSSGKVAIEMAQHFVNDDYQVTLLLTKNIKNSALDKLCKKKNFDLIRFETTEELLNCIQSCSTMHEYDIVIHSAAVADYKPAFSFRAEDMADEITRRIRKLPANDMGYERVYDIVLNTLTGPDCKVNDKTKISSVEPNLTVKLGLTPKIIASLRQFFPNAFICGFKLLGNVSEDELVDAAVKQIKKCNTNLVFANDLAELRKGNSERLVVQKNGYDGIKVNGAYGIYNLVKIATSEY